jgi:hypothetical protein
MQPDDAYLAWLDRLPADVRASLVAQNGQTVHVVETWHGEQTGEPVSVRVASGTLDLPSVPAIPDHVPTFDEE